MYLSAGSAEVGAHLVAGGLDAVDPLVAGHGAGDEAVHGIEEHLADGAETGDGLVGGEGAQGSLGAGVVDAVEDLVVAAELVDNAGDGCTAAPLAKMSTAVSLYRKAMNCLAASTFSAPAGIQACSKKV